jgi:hypothetical protein
VHVERPARDVDADAGRGDLAVEVQQLELGELLLVLPVLVAPLERRLEAGRARRGLCGSPEQ